MAYLNTDVSFQERLVVWEGGWKIFKDYPIIGCGYKCVDKIHSRYPDPTGAIGINRGMHSNILQLLVDTGIVGFVAWLSIWVTYFIEFFRRHQVLARDETQSDTKGMLLGASAGVLGFLVGGFFESNFYDSEVVMLLYFIMGLSLAKVKNVPKLS